VSNGWTEHDLYSPGILAKFTSQFQPDAIIWGTVTVEQGLITIDIVDRNPSGNELFRAHYEQPVDAHFQADIDATAASMPYFFAGLDGVTIPKCVTCPIPQYPAALHSSGVEDRVILSVIITPEGKPADIRVVRKTEPRIESAAIKAIQAWSFAPSHDSDGIPVPVRIPIEITFRHN
jgi:TonB family protein